MIPDSIQRYLENAGVAYVAREHPLAVSAGRLAEVLEVSGHRVAKTVLLASDGERILVMLPAHAKLDLAAVARVAGLPELHLADEAEFGRLFPGCEIGAAPPFGNLWEIPVVVDVLLAHPGTIYLRAGTHEDVLEMEYVDFADLEDPLVAAVSYEGEELAGGELPREFGADAF